MKNDLFLHRMLQTRSYERCRSSGDLIQWKKSLFDTILVYNIKNKPMLRYKFGSVYIVSTILDTKRKLNACVFQFSLINCLLLYGETELCLHDCMHSSLQ